MSDNQSLKQSTNEILHALFYEDKHGIQFSYLEYTYIEKILTEFTQRTDLFNLFMELWNYHLSAPTAKEE